MFEPYTIGFAEDFNRYVQEIGKLENVKTQGGYTCYWAENEGISLKVPRDKIVVDVGCSFGLQHVLYQKHKGWIGIQKFKEGVNCDDGFKPNFKIFTNNARIIEGYFRDVWQQIGINEQNKNDYFGISYSSLWNDPSENKLDIEIFKRLFPKNYYVYSSTNSEKVYFTNQPYVSESEVPHFHRQIILDELKKFQWDSLLEVGCGVGTNFYYLQREFPEAKLHGIDIQNGLIDIARHDYPDIDIDIGNGIGLGFETKSIDVVLYDATLMYFKEEHADMALKEAERVVKKAIILCDQKYFDKIKDPDAKIPIKGWDVAWDKGFIVVKYL